VFHIRNASLDKRLALSILRRMKRPIIIIHGWSDNSTSFRPLAKFLKASTGRPVLPIFLADYLSMNDEVSLPDLGAAMINALSRQNIPTHAQAFDAIVHSTGGLVVREFLHQFCRNPDGTQNPKLSPIANLLMLAPANFGSPLARMGKSMVGRLFKGWKWDGPFETGTQVLDALELGSPYSWELAQRDLFDPSFPIFAPEHTRVTVITGTNAYPDRLKQMAHENGSDGTVRVATANLNARAWKLTLEDPTNPKLTEVARNCPEFAMAVFDRNHSSIARDIQSQREAWQQVVLGSLAVDAAGYGALVQQCQSVTNATFVEGRQPGKRNQERFHEFLHAVFRVRDQYGNPIPDYFLEFYQEANDARDQVFTKIQTEVLEKVTCNSQDKSIRSLFFDTTDLDNLQRERPDLEVRLSIVAANLSKDIYYRNPPNQPHGGIPVFRSDLRSFFLPNQPVLIDVTLFRDPSQRVFRLNALDK
jgi:pimeloyl-ACP methyl ester carboxylesterase